MDDRNAPRNYQPAAIVLGVGVCIYFLCPDLFALPFVMIYGRTAEPPPAVRAFFWPVLYLSERVPPYAELLSWEGKWFGF